MTASTTPPRRSILRASARQRRLLILALARSALWTGNRLDEVEGLLRAVERIVDLELHAALIDD
jgi:hypothetical protein